MAALKPTVTKYTRHHKLSDELKKAMEAIKPSLHFKQLHRVKPALVDVGWNLSTKDHVQIWTSMKGDPASYRWYPSAEIPEMTTPAHLLAWISHLEKQEQRHATESDVKVYSRDLEKYLINAFNKEMMPKEFERTKQMVSVQLVAALDIIRDLRPDSDVNLYQIFD